MTRQDWLQLLSPLASAVVAGTSGLVAICFARMAARLAACLDRHGAATAAQGVAAANSVVQAALATGAATMAGRIARGELDYADRRAVLAEAEREASLLAARVPEMLAALNPVPGAVTAALMGRLDAQVVAAGLGTPPR